MAIRRRILLGSALGAPFIRTARAAPIQLRVSLDTAPNHRRTQSIADFLNKLEAASQGEIKPQLFDSGKLMSDQDVIKALVSGQVEMAVPGTWLVAGYVPDADLGQLPVFYGQPVETTHRAIDGVPGDLVNERIARKLRVKIPGRWIDLGFTNWYSGRRPLYQLADLKGLKIRNQGGYAQPWRTRFFGAIPTAAAWLDVPMALAQGTFDALQTTSESCASAKLWDAGLHFGLIDHQSMGNFIPMFSEDFWTTLSPALKSLVTDLWAANIGIYRTNVAASQDQAGRELKSRGVRLVYVPVEDLAEQRKLMLAEQERVAREMKISSEMLSRIDEAVGTGG